MSIMSRSRIEPTLAAALSILGFALPFSISAQSVVYDNTSVNLNKIYATPAEYGDQITLGGSARTAAAFELTYYSSYNLSSGAVVRLYANDGPAVSGSNSPGELLYQSAAFDIVKSDVSDPNNVLGSKVTINLAGTGLVVPDTLTWTVSFAGVSGANEAGAVIFNPPSVGSSDSKFWQRDGASWALSEIPGTPGNFSAKLTAVPEPGQVALASIGAIGWLALAGYRRSKK
jgi:hypothetical protein